MKKCLLIPDSFKGTMTSMEICNLMKARILKYFPDCDIVSIPVADGGEGTVDCFLYILGGKKVTVKVKGPVFKETEAFYGISGDTAFIEMAAVAGFSKIQNNFNVAKATTFGVGQLIKDAVSNGCHEIILSLGGSCTNDCGAGAAVALGTKFYSKCGEPFIPTGGNLGMVSRIDVSESKALLEGCHITAMCDVDNPLYGKTGAAFVYGPQKGADNEMVKLLDGQLRLFSESIKKSLNIDIAMESGAGAGGGMGAGAVAFLGAKMKKGIDIILDLIKFENVAKDCDIIFTGEGKIDAQSLRGKVVIGIAKRAEKMKVPVVAIVGDVGDGIKGAYDCGVSGIFSTNLKAVPFNEERGNAKSNLSFTMDNVVRLIKTAERFPKYSH